MLQTCRVLTWVRIRIRVLYRSNRWLSNPPIKYNTFHTMFWYFSALIRFRVRIFMRSKLNFTVWNQADSPVTLPCPPTLSLQLNHITTETLDPKSMRVSLYWVSALHILLVLKQLTYLPQSASKQRVSLSWFCVYTHRLKLQQHTHHHRTPIWDNLHGPLTSRRVICILDEKKKWIAHLIHVDKLSTMYFPKEKRWRRSRLYGTI